MRIRLTLRAQSDLRAQIDWLAEHAPRSADKASHRIFNALDLLADFPRSGRVLNGVQREKIVEFGRYGFIIRYELHPNEVIVTAILHGRQAR